MSGIREHQLGKGTLGYKGETAEYFESKRGLWSWARWVIAGLFVVLGVAFLVAAASPVVPARVVSVTGDGSDGTVTVGLQAPDGTTGTAVVAYVDAPAVGSVAQVSELPGGRLVVGDQSETGRAAAVVLLSVGLGIAGWAVYRLRRPRPDVTPVLVPDDAYDRPPVTG